MDIYCKICGVKYRLEGNPQICANGHETYANPFPWPCCCSRSPTTRAASAC